MFSPSPGFQAAPSGSPRRQHPSWLRRGVGPWYVLVLGVEGVGFRVSLDRIRFFLIFFEPEIGKSLVVPCWDFFLLHGIRAGSALLSLLLGVLLSALLQLGDVLVCGAVGLDGLLAVRGQFGLPVALAGLLLGEGVLLVLVVVLVICVGVP